MNDRTRRLDAETCTTLLGENHFGRVAVDDGDGPVVLPVNYVLDGRAVVFRSDDGTKVEAAAAGSPACFEIDAIDERTRTGWSVLVRGRLGEVTDADDLARLRRLPLEPFAGGGKPRYLRLPTDHVSGRRIRVPDEVPAGWLRPSGLGHVWRGQDATDLGV